MRTVGRGWRLALSSRSAHEIARRRARLAAVPRARSTSRLPCAEAQTLLGGNELPHIPAEPRIPPPAIAIAVASAVVAIVPYLLDRAILNSTGLQLLKHARCRRGVRCGHREAERNAQRSDRQQLTCHDVVPPSRFQSATPCDGTQRNPRRKRKRAL